MDSSPDKSKPDGNDPQPQIIKPTSVPNEALASAPQPSQAAVPAPDTFSPTRPATDLPNLPSQPVSQPPVVSGQAPQSPVDTAKLFQADTNLPELNTQHGNFVVDNRPPGRLKRIFKNKKITVLLAALLIAIIVIGGGVFGYYLPNRPSAVWNTGLDRSGEALDKLLTQATDKKQLESFKKSQVDASLTVNAQGSTFKGDFTGRFDQSKANGSLNVSVDQGGNSAKLAMKYISMLASGATYPDFYVQFNGIKDFGLDGFVPGINDYDGKWISMDSNYFKSLNLPVPVPGQKNDDNQINADNVSELIRAVSSVSKDYILTSSKDRAVIKQIKFIGKEKTDGISTYHYLAGIDKTHGEAYCQALYDKVATTSIYKKFGGPDVNKTKNEDIKACKKYDIDDNVKTNFDVWIDAKYKLIHKIRIPDDSNKQAYTEIGQTYKGGDDISLFVNYHDGKSPMDARLTFSTNIKSIDGRGEFTIKGGKGSDAYDGKVTFAIKPLTGDLNLQKPANAIPIKDILKKYGFDPSQFTSISDGQQSQANDADRKSDINAIYSQVEVYFAENGYYPTLSELNNSSWRSANLTGFNSDLLQPPDSSSPTMASSASDDQYGYSASGCNTKGCRSFTLTAKLSNGQKYTKTSLNN